MHNSTQETRHSNNETNKKYTGTNIKNKVKENLKYINKCQSALDCSGRLTEHMKSIKNNIFAKSLATTRLAHIKN